MQTFTKLSELAPLVEQGCAVSWGNFDGVHLGHQALLRGLVSRARGLTLPSVAVSFDPHPALFFKGSNAPHLITDLPDRLALLEQLGVDYALVLPFDAAFARQSPEEFIKTVIVDGLRAKAVLLGYDVGFGQKRSGGIRSLIELGKKYGFSAEQTQPTLGPAASGDPAALLPVSSTTLREAIKNGDFNLATRLTGRAHSVHSLVEHGAGRGSGLLGFPTANIDPGSLLLPPYGVYACLVKSGGRFYNAAVNLGVNPSFNGNKASLEAHILDFDGTLYGREIRIYFLRFLRTERKFATIGKLTAQITQDVKNAASIAAQARLAPNFDTLYPL